MWLIPQVPLMMSTKFLEEKLRHGRLDAKTLDNLFRRRIEQGANWGMATIPDKMGHCLHRFFTSPARVSLPCTWKRDLDGSHDGESRPF